MRRPASLFLVVAVLASSVVLAQPAPKRKVTAFEVGRVIVGNGQPWIEDAVLVVEDGRFTQVGRRATVKIPRGATRVNLSGKNVMPAIVDALTQIAGTRDEVTDHLRRRAHYGAAAIMGLATDANSPLFQVRDEIIPNAAQFVAAARIAALQPVDSPSTVADARQAVQDLAAKKVEVITIGSPGVSAAIVEQAHASGLRVMAYVKTLQDMKDVLRAGVDVLLGLPRDRLFDRELLLLFRERPKVVLIPNLSDRGVADDFGWLRNVMREDERAQLPTATGQPEAQATFDIQRQTLGRLHLEKVRIALGSDSGVAWGHLLEMEDMSAAINPADAIVAAAQNSAQLLGFKDHGAIVPGNVANFLVLEGNPAMEIRQIRNITAVYLAGTQVTH